jgi:sterol desaturase/sphingolipid hydroxylase (fatty acid hydroxylase superfamily)
MNTLQTTMTNLLESDWQKNPAMTTLMNDYIRGHLIVAVLSGIFAVLLFGFAIFALVRLVQSRKSMGRKWTLVQKTQLSLTVVSSFVGLLMGLIALINTLTALNPIEGFSSIAATTTTSITSPVGQALLEWIDSGSQNIPTALGQKVSNRTTWQQPKAIVSWVLLGLFGFLGFYIWRRLIVQSNVGRWYTKGFLLTSGTFTVAACCLLMVMAVANTANGFAPLAISVFGAGG